MTRNRKTEYSSSGIPGVNEQSVERPRYKQSSVWAWITTGVMILAVVIVTVVSDAQERKAKARRPPLRPWTEVMTPEELHMTGLDRPILSGDNPQIDPEKAAKDFHEFIQKGGNADPLVDPLEQVDYHDLLDQMGGPEGF